MTRFVADTAELNRHYSTEPIRRRKPGGPSRSTDKPGLVTKTVGKLLSRFPDSSRPTVVPDPTTLSSRDREQVGGSWMFVVAARAEQPGPPPPVVAGRPKRLDATTEPVGIQHAAAARLDAGALRLALCGADIAGWIIFANRPFDVGGAAVCQRCAQLKSRPGGSGHRDAVPDAVWWIHADEPLVRHHVPTVTGEGAGTAVCLTESLSWRRAPVSHPGTKTCASCAGLPD